MPFHVCINLTELIARETIESVSDRGHDSEAERLLATIIEFCLWGVKGEVDEIASGKQQTARNHRDDIVFSGCFN